MITHRLDGSKYWQSSVSLLKLFSFSGHWEVTLVSKTDMGFGPQVPCALRRHTQGKAQRFRSWSGHFACLQQWPSHPYRDAKSKVLESWSFKRLGGAVGCIVWEACQVRFCSVPSPQPLSVISRLECNIQQLGKLRMKFILKPIICVLPCDWMTWLNQEQFARNVTASRSMLVSVPIYSPWSCCILRRMVSATLPVTERFYRNAHLESKKC